MSQIPVKQLKMCNNTENCTLSETEQINLEVTVMQHSYHGKVSLSIWRSTKPSIQISVIIKLNY